MKKKVFTLALALTSVVLWGQTRHVITASGFSFTPADISVDVGDTVEFAVGSTHPTVQVSQSTWNANGTTQLAGGFDFPSGNGSFVVSQAQTHYYVCKPHVGAGMKGRIMINTIGVDQIPIGEISIFPNPVSEKLVVQLPYTASLELRIIDMNGKLLKELQNLENTEEHRLNIRDLKPGIYLLQVTDDRGSRQLRFVKE